MSLPNLEATWTNRPEEYGIEPPLSLINRIKSIENLRSFGGVTNNYTTYKFSDFEVGKIFFVESLDDGYSPLGATNLRFIDPNSVFILPEPKEYDFASNYQFPPQINGYKYDHIIELPKIRTGSIFYRQLGTYSLDACLLAFNRETRELLSSSCVPVFEVSYNVQYYYDSKLRISSRVGRYFPLSLAYGINMEPYGWSTYNPAQLITSFNSENYDFLRECIRGSFFSFPTLTAVGTNNSISLSLFYSSNLNNNFMDGAINTDLSYFEIFHNIIVVKDGNDLDSIIEGTDEEWEDRISGGEEYIPDDTGPYDPGGTSTGGGGGGSFYQPDPVETILPDGSSELDSSNAGVFTRYLVSPSQLKVFGDWLWSDDIIQALLKEVINIVYGKSSEAVISLMSYPFSMAGIGLAIEGSNLWFGNVDSGVLSSGKLTKEFASIDWGTISLDGYWNNFLDYAPHTTINLYLPWLGFVPVDPHECLPGSLTVKTNVELGRGTAVHNVIGNGGVCIGQYSTVCGRQLPITALDTGGKLTSMVVSAVAAGVSAGAAGGAKSAGISAANSWQAAAARYSAPSWEAGNRAVEALAARAEAPYRRVQTSANRVAAASAVASLRPPQIHQRSGSSTGNSAGLGCQYPYVIIGRPTQSVPEQYGSHFGYPSNIYAILGTLKGYTEISSIHLDGFACTTEERSEIDELLKGGVIF